MKLSTDQLQKMINWGKTYIDESMSNISEFADPETDALPKVREHFLNYSYGAADYEFSDCADWLYSDLGADINANDFDFSISALDDLEDNDRKQINASILSHLDKIQSEIDFLS